MSDHSTQTWLAPPWRFHIELPSGFQAHPGSQEAPNKQLRLRLEHFENAETGVRLEVEGISLEREVSPVQWLRWAILGDDDAQARNQIAEREPGTVAAVDRPAGDAIEKLVAIKSGARMFLLRWHLSGADSGQHAAAIEQATGTFAPQEPAPQRYAEPLRAFEQRTPIPWRVMVPRSWIIEPDGSSDSGSSFQADSVRRLDDQKEEVIGKLSFAVLARDRVETPEAAADLYFNALEGNGLRIERGDSEKLEARLPFKSSWQLEATIWRDDMEGWGLCRVMHSEEVWALGGVLSPRREDDLQAWLANCRALQLAMMSLKLRP